VQKTMRIFDDRLSASKYLAGEFFSIADITAKVALDFGIRFSGIVIPDDVEHFTRWNQLFETRESTKI
jgi:glutathione S-transferase